MALTTKLHKEGAAGPILHISPRPYLSFESFLPEHTHIEGDRNSLRMSVSY